MSAESLPHPEPGPNIDATPADAISHTDQMPETEALGLKEFRRMLEEMQDDEAAIAQIIEDVLMEPIPDTADAEASARFNAKMSIIRDAANVQLGRSQMWLRLNEQLEGRSEISGDTIDK